MSAENLEFCPVLVDMVRNRNAVGRSGKRFEEIGALSTQRNLWMLRSLQMELHPKRTLEIGLGFGGSCLVFTSTHRDLRGGAKKQHLALDPFQTSDWDDVGLITVERAGLTGFLDFRPRFSCQELPQLVEQKEKFDLVYVDGSHLFEDVFVDLYFVSRLLSDGGVVAFDDSTLPSVRKVLQFVRKNFRASFAELDLSSHRLDQGKPLKYRLARLLGKVQMTAFRRIGPPLHEWNAPFVDF